MGTKVKIERKVPTHKHMKTNQKPYFSVVIPTLNEEKYVPFLLKDLTNQTNQDFEVIIADGKSTDKTKSKSLSFQKDLKLTFIESSKKNVSFQRNLGASQSQSPWLIFMDADNRIPPYFIQGLRYQIDRQLPDFFITYIDPDGNQAIDRAFAQVMNTFFKTQANIQKPYMLESLFGIKNEVFKAVKGFDQRITWSEGGDLLKRLTAKKFLYKIFKEPRYIYSSRRMKKEGSLNALVNSLYLIILHQTGIKISQKMFQKYYPMEGGSFFQQARKSPSSIENRIREIISNKEFRTVIETLNQPITLKKIFPHRGKKTP